MLKTKILLSTFVLFSNLGFAAGNADVVNALARNTAPGEWSFRVTVSHPDTGWEDYADGWDIVLPDGTVVKPAAKEEFTRTLWHPHVNEQPFTRSQGGVKIPAGVNQVTVRAHDKRDGFGGKTVIVTLP
ncbi:MAG: hypothetical protein GY726_15065 [Proteobacteria bacterium]|nr:hypothetical protein [Pseudomonadota bacterium]